MKKNFILFGIIIACTINTLTAISALTPSQQTALGVFTSRANSSIGQIQKKLAKINLAASRAQVSDILEDLKDQESKIVTEISALAKAFNGSINTSNTHELLFIGYEATEMYTALNRDENFIPDQLTLSDYQKRLIASGISDSLVSSNFIVNGQVTPDGVKQGLETFQYLKTEVAQKLIQDIVNYHSPDSPDFEILKWLSTTNTDSSSTYISNQLGLYYSKILTVVTEAFSSDGMSFLWNVVQDYAKEVSKILLGILSHYRYLDLQLDDSHLDGFIDVLPTDPKKYVLIDDQSGESVYRNHMYRNQYITNASDIVEKARESGIEIELDDLNKFEQEKISAQTQKLISTAKSLSIPVTYLTISPISLRYAIDNKTLAEKIWEAYNAHVSTDEDGKPVIFASPDDNESTLTLNSNGKLVNALSLQRIYSADLKNQYFVAYDEGIEDNAVRAYIVRIEKNPTTHFSIQYIQDLDHIILLDSNGPVLFDKDGKNIGALLSSRAKTKTATKLNAPILYKSDPKSSDAQSNNVTPISSKPTIHYLLFNSPDKKFAFDAYQDKNNIWNFKPLQNWERLITQDTNGDPILFDKTGDEGRRLYHESGDSFLSVKSLSGLLSSSGLLSVEESQGSSSIGSSIDTKTAVYNVYNEFGTPILATITTDENNKTVLTLMAK